MKKLISIVLLCATAVLLCACGSAAPDKSASDGTADADRFRQRYSACRRRT